MQCPGNLVECKSWISFDKSYVNCILYYRCGHCKRLAPTWEELARKFIQDSEISIAKVDCTLEESKALCSEQEVDGFPTLFLYKDGRKISEYTGNRAIDDLHSFVVKNIAHDEL